MTDHSSNKNSSLEKADNKSSNEAGKMLQLPRVGIINVEIRKDPADKMFVCPLCSSRFPLKRNLSLHIHGRHRQERPNEIFNVVFLDADEFQCDECKRSFPSRPKLTQHMVSSHTPLQCEICEKGFLSKYNLLQHNIKIHKKEKPFACHTCGETFHLTDLLRQHFEKDHSTSEANYGRKFECDKCPMHFDKFYKLQRHMNTHGSYECPWCDKLFINEQILNLHFTSKHINKIATQLKADSEDELELEIDEDELAEESDMNEVKVHIKEEVLDTREEVHREEEESNAEEGLLIIKKEV